MKRKKYCHPREIREYYQQNNLTDEDLRQELWCEGIDENRLNEVVQQILHPTEYQLYLESTVTDEDLYEEEVESPS